MALGHLGAEEQRRPDRGPAAANVGLALPFAGLADEGDDACQGTDLLAAQRAELREVGNHGAGDDRADARDRGQQVFLLPPHWRATHGVVDVMIDVGELALQSDQQPFDALAYPRHLGAPQPLALRRLSSRRSGGAAQAGSASMRVAWSGNGRTTGLVASAKRAITRASIGSVLARWPSALAKARTWAGLTTTRGKACTRQAGSDDVLVTAGRLERHHASACRPAGDTTRQGHPHRG